MPPTVLRIFFVAAVLLLHVVPARGREVVNFNEGWKFAKGHIPDAASTGFDDSSWRKVVVPHDWAIEGPFLPDADGLTGKLPWRGEGWYRKRFSMNPAHRGKRIYFLFDGIMAHPKIHINGRPVGGWDYGYNSFYLDATDFIDFGGTNIMAVHADTREQESRTYPGAGIFRKISMVVVHPVHVGIWGTRITTPEVRDDLAQTRILTTVKNTTGGAEDVRVETSVFGPDGKKVGESTTDITLGPGASREYEQRIAIADPLRWDIDNPALYEARTLLVQRGAVLDDYATPFGVRTFRFTPDDGFHLNGRRVQIKGLNIHHDLGPLGAAFNKRAEERRLELLKGMGCNAIRTAHNVSAPELLDLCDRMGLLVLNEAFDRWDRMANILPETDFFEFGERNIRNFILRDRNHPSVVLWSVGNEMSDVQRNLDGGLKKLEAMVGYVRKYDLTRPVCMACDDLDWVDWRHLDHVDVHCWNYGRRYLQARQRSPNKGIVLAESASTVSSRGYYEFPLPSNPTDFGYSLQVSSYDLNWPPWAEAPDDDFLWLEEDSYVAGEFVWTGFDYLGEPTPFDDEFERARGIAKTEVAKSSYFGILDLSGVPKDRYYLYRSRWKPEETTVHIVPHWNWEGREGLEVPVFVYTSGDCADLFLNGKPLGRRCKKPDSKISLERYRLMWKGIPYEPGELKAVAFKDGREIGEKIVKTSGRPRHLRLTPDRNVLRPDGEDLSYILVEAFDDDGNPCPKADNLVVFSVSGPAEIAAVDNGNPQSFEPFRAEYRRLFAGKAMLVVRSMKGREGAIGITAVSNGLRKGGARIRSRR